MNCPTCTTAMRIPKGLAVWECTECPARWFLLQTSVPKREPGPWERVEVKVEAKRAP
jgi:hypothetical protein